MTNTVLIVGGYGAVGSVIASQLTILDNLRVIVAGRNPIRAQQSAANLGPHVEWRTLDVSQPLDYPALLSDVQYVVMCLDLPQIEFVRQCFVRGIHYIDISAEYPILSAIADLDPLAKQHAATAVLSVGLIPGLSNLMARHSLRFIDPIDRFDTAILGGLGEKHGVAASAWVLNHFGDSGGMTRFQFREPFHRKSVYRFGFSDQYTLPQTLPITTAATWLGFDSFFMTHLIGLSRLPILYHVFQNHAVQKLLLNSTQRWQFGKDDFVLTTRACGPNGTYQAWWHGQGEAKATGLITAEVVRQLITKKPPSGVLHIEQLFELDDFKPVLHHHMTFFESHTLPSQPTTS